MPEVGQELAGRRALSRAEVRERRKVLRSVMLRGSAGLSVVGWIAAVVIVRMSDHPAEEAMVGMHGSPLGAMTPMLMLGTSCLLAALVMAMVTLGIVWRIKFPTFLKVMLTIVLLGASWGLFAVTFLAGVFASGTEPGKISTTRPVQGK